mgnify:CR=1 FL=1
MYDFSPSQTSSQLSDAYATCEVDIKRNNSTLSKYFQKISCDSEGVLFNGSLIVVPHLAAVKSFENFNQDISVMVLRGSYFIERGNYSGSLFVSPENMSLQLISRNPNLKDVLFPRKKGDNGKEEYVIESESTFIDNRSLPIKKLSEILL